MAINKRVRTRAPRVSSNVTFLRIGLAATFVFALLVTEGSAANASSSCKSSGYACTVDGYDATTMTIGWAARYYGRDTKGGIGTPAHNCTLFAAWMLAHNGLPDPGHSWGYADQWGLTLAAETNQTPTVGSVAWYDGPGMGHVAYVAHVNWSNHTVFLVSDNYAPKSAGYTSNTWAPFNQPTGYIHLRDLSAPLPMAARRIGILRNVLDRLTSTSIR